MNIFGFSVKRPVTVTVILLAVIVIGLIFGSRINIEDFPRIEIPVVTVQTIYQGAGPEEIEEQITIPVEEAVGSVSNIDEIESISQENLSVVIVRFNYGTDMNAAAADIREKMDRITTVLPSAAESPVISKADVGDTPIVRLTLTGPEGNLRRLRSVANNDVKKEIEKIGGISSVTVSGGQERALVVKVDRDRMEARNISVNQIVNSIAKENQNIPSGRITTDLLEFSVRAMGELEDVKDFNSLMVGQANGTPIYLEDVAEVYDDIKEVRTKTRINGSSCVTIEVRKNTDANTVNVARDVKTAVAGVQKTLPEGFNLTVSYDSSRFILEAISNLQSTALQGALLAVLMVLLFLGSARSTLVIALSIPSSVIATFLLMYFNNFTVNMMTLVGFILAVGNIVDASIVVLENIFRHIEMGKDTIEAAVDGSREVGGAVMGAALTTAIVFVPVMLIEGLPGQIFTPLAKTFIFAILTSLAMAIFMVPMLASRFLRGELERKNDPKKLIGKFNNWFSGVFEKITGIYKVILNWSLRHRFLVILFSLIFLGVSLYSARFLRLELQGRWDRGDFMVSIETPVGSSISRTELVTLEVEEFILKNTPEYDSIITDIGQGPSGARRGARGATGAVPRMGGISVALKPADIRQQQGQRDMYQVQDMITEQFRNYAGANIQVESTFNISGKKPLEILVRGNDQDILAQIATRLMEKLQNVRGLRNLDLSYRPGAPEFRIIIDRKKAGELGFGSQEVAGTLRALLSEDEVSKFRDEGNEYDIFVQLPESQRDSTEKIKNLKLITPSGKQVPLSEVAEVVPSFGPSSITRRDRARYVSVQADTTGDVALSEMLAEVMPILEQEQLPSGYDLTIAGEEQQRGEIFDEMFQALFLAIILVYVFLAVQFESFLHPFTIMLSVPLELGGLFGALFITNTTMTMFTLLGVIMLVGIVVSAAIVLIDYIIQRKESGMDTMDAIREAAPLRVRPIMMTIGTTILAMIPLALGLKAGTELYQPMAIGAIGGLLTSSVLTLLVIPVVYSLLEELKEKKSKKNI